ncbi:hypothetical protein [Rivularia sp. UHCC 0363]|uniref:hypothetical protein n=1 Tax=Rivularia sp. UHCC 0363 TaxID=3110244 RepID=UPI002B2136BF|nr:hypothetical protein [Rivularia sp. UHCC 0363]MEA5595672.1 hypothetical protein [Rivularia sp. UHCC 0363]
MKLIDLARFRELRLFEAFAKTGVVLTAIGAILLGSSFAVARNYLEQQEDVPVIVKKTIILGIGTITGSSIFAIAAAIEDDRRCELRVIAPERKLLPVTCRNCKYFNNDYILQCAVNPLIAGTQAALDCKDFDSYK